MRPIIALLSFLFSTWLPAQRVIEELTFEVPEDQTERFLELDTEIWTAVLARQPGFLKKETLRPRKPETEIRLLVHWQSSAAWGSVPKKLLAETNKKFEEAMGGKENFKLVSVRALKFLREDLPKIPDIHPSLDLASLDLSSFRHEKVVIPHDAVYRKEKTYRAIPLSEVVETWLSKMDSRPSVDSHEILFECADGYAPARPLASALTDHAFLAFSDLDAPAGLDWSPKKKINGSELVFAPFYLVWNDADKKTAAARPWPHNLVRLKVVPSAGRYDSLKPGDAKHGDGFRLFKTHCIVCHALGGTGGAMGPDLAAPRNITTYWKKDQLLPFIKNPASFRKNAKMPPMNYVGDKKLRKVIAYLESLAESE